MYISPGALRSVLVPGGDRNDRGTAAALSDEDLTRAIEQASAMVDLAISNRYTFPLPDPAPASVQVLVEQIAAYFATLLWRRGVDLAPTDPIALRYATAASALRDLTEGRTSLPDLPDENTSDSGGATVYNPYSVDLVGTLDSTQRHPYRWHWSQWPGGS